MDKILFHLLRLPRNISKKPF